MRGGTESFQSGHATKGGLGGIQFEMDVHALLDALGWSVERTAVSGDFGADLIARAGGEVLVVQCKDYGSPAGIGAVQEVHFACAHYQASAAAVVARNGFTRAAIQAAKTSGVHLLRPTEVAIGCPFDRTLHKKEIERQRWAEYQAQENNRKSEIWKQYDVALSRFNTKLRNRPRWLKAICIIGIPLIFVTNYKIWSDSNYPAIASLLCLQGVAFFAWWLISRPSPPPKPEFNRRGSIITCRACRQKLRIDFGREGSVLCPKCKNSTTVVVDAVDPRRHEAADANFFP